MNREGTLILVLVLVLVLYWYGEIAIQQRDVVAVVDICLVMRLMKYIKERREGAMRCLHGAKRSLVGGDLICTSVVSVDHGIWKREWRASGEDKLSSSTDEAKGDGGGDGDGDGVAVKDGDVYGN